MVLASSRGCASQSSLLKPLKAIASTSNLEAKRVDLSHPAVIFFFFLDSLYLLLIVLRIQFLFFFIFFYFLFVVDFVIHWNETAMGLHVFPSWSPLPPPSPPAPSRFSQCTRSRALVSCIQPALVICFPLDTIHVSMQFSWNIPPSPAVFHRMKYGHFKEDFYLPIGPLQLNFQTLLMQIDYTFP